ncbi:MAG: glycoside hydrolase [Burkholderiales bacterium]|nr:glycoside hydrolase [Burkholderiales bacterium]
MMQADPRITDLRWMAYMLATAFWEAAHTVSETIQVPKVGKGKKPILGPDNQPVMIDKQIKVWEVMVPIDEISVAKKRRYKAPVKVKKIDSDDAALLAKLSKKFSGANILGGAWIVEKDGDQFVVAPPGTEIWRSKSAAVGATFAGAASSTYTKFHGDEHAYFGRGYVQLTWWNNYVSAGTAIGRGLDLLFDPSLVKEPQTAYDVMAHGMLTGAGFANKHKLSDYIIGSKTDYFNARKMVNSADSASYQPIADSAVLFEEMLIEAKR